jgi:hypothetical protein
MMQRLANSLKHHQALYPIDPESKTPLEPKVP